MSTIILKPYNYISLIDASDWLKFPDPGVLNASGTTEASLTVQDILYKSKALLGAEGNVLKVEYLAGGVAGQEEVTFSNDILSVKIANGISTATQIKSAVESHFQANRYFTVTVTGVGSNPQNAAAATSLASGINATKYDARLYRTVVKIINASIDKIESIINGPVLTREFSEEHDGSNSNTIKPHHWPVRAITEVRIDYNRAFGPTSVIPDGQYFLRGGSDIKQVSGDVSLRVIGNDVVLRDDNENFILGRIFSGSVLGSIKIKYKAGWGETIEDLPQDLVLATQQLMEFFYYMRENRDIAVQSKGVKGESYTRLKDGIPEVIFEMIEKYEDMSLGTGPVPQRNYFRV